MIPAQSRGAAPARSRVRGNLENKFLIDDDAFRIAAVSNAAAELVGRVIGQSEIGAELLKPFFAGGAGAVGVDHATDSGNVAGLEFGDRGAGCQNAADNFVAGYQGVDGGKDVLHSLRTWCKSEWQMPQNRISICTSFSVGSRR